MTPLEQATWVWRLRNSRRYRDVDYPLWLGCVPWDELKPVALAGHIDNHNRWWPNPCEVEACCRAWGVTKFPGSKFPKSRALWMHCCSYAHVATKFGVNARELRRHVRALDALEALRR